MITLCSVIYGENKHYIPYFKENIFTKTKLVKEICFCHTDKNEDYTHEYDLGSIHVKEFGLTIENNYHNGLVTGHSFGMVAAINKASQPYIYMCDPDLLLYCGVDEIYLNFIDKYKLNFIGAAHHIAINYSCKHFPNPINMMVKKSDLPTNGNYLYPHIPKTINTYPNPHGIVDTGVLLYEWNQQMKGKWLSFLTLDTHNYTTAINRNNFELKDRFAKTKLFYHATSGATKHLWEEFLDIDKKIKHDMP